MAGKKEDAVSKKMLAAEQQEKKRSTHPVLILVAGFVSAILLLGCCVCGFATWWFRPEIHEDAERARQVVAEMVEIQIPDSYQPKGTIEWNVAFAMSVKGAYYERFVGDGILTLIEVNSRFRSDDDVRKHIRQTLIEKGGGGTPLLMDDTETTAMTVEIRGRQVPFTFEIGRDPPSGRTFHIVEGVFEGKSGEVLLSMRVNDEHWEKTSIEEMLQSIGKLPISAETESPDETEILPEEPTVPETNESPSAPDQ